MSRVCARALRSLPVLGLTTAFLAASCGGATFTSNGSAGNGAIASSGFANGGSAGSGNAGSSGQPSGGSAGAEVVADGGEAGANAGGGNEAGSGGAGTAGAGAAGAPAGGSSGSAGTAGSMAGAAGSGPPPDTVCPSDPPGNEACVSGLSCSYGEDLRSRCRAQYACMNGKWAAMAVKCPTLIACIDRPAGFPKSGDLCSMVGEDCTLDNGPYGKVYCRCDACATGSCAQAWECAGPPAGCPIVVPNDGQPCDMNGSSCQYGNCSMANALQVQCTKKIWHWLPVACPKM
jgi:hypothetical protein